MQDIAFDLKNIVLILTAGFVFAGFFGYFTYKAKLSPILGYLIAGYFIGPYSPGLVADVHIAEQLAEIGVILMMFGVGLHFKWQDLLRTKSLSLPGAIGQTLVATLSGLLLMHMLGWSLETGLVFGFSISVASTVVLIRVLTDNRLLHLPEGQKAVGWLIVEDIITVLMLLILPMLAPSESGTDISFLIIMKGVAILLAKVVALTIILFTIGRRLVSYILSKVAKTNSHELFTLTTLALTFAIAAGASFFFGVSIALGAFLAGMLIGQTQLHKRVEHNSMPMRDAFVVLFFISVGMLFNPSAIIENLFFFSCTLAIILLIKPLIAFVITIALKQPYRMGAIIALALAQIGEFSFILAEEGMKLNILPDEIFDVIVACAIVSIAINPLLFKFCNFPTSPDDKKAPPPI